MSEEDLETVRAMYDRRERGDLDVAEFVHSETAAGLPPA
jgi:hypothetical protein